MNIQIASFFIGFISLFIAYCFAVTVANFVHVWVADICGDSTGKDFGYLTLNPFAHVDIFGIITLFVLYCFGIYFGWGPRVPVDPYAIKSKFKLCCAYLADACAHFIMALSGVIVLVLLFGSKIVVLSQYMILYHKLDHLTLTHYFPTVSSLVIVIGFIIIVQVYLNMILGILKVITDGCQLVPLLFSNNKTYISQANESFSAMVLPLVLIFFFSGILRYIAVMGITFAGYGIVRLLGLI